MTNQIEQMGEITTKLAEYTLELALTAQMAAFGNLVATLVNNQALTGQQASGMLEETAGVISESASRPDAPPLMARPLQKHVEALRALAKMASSSQ